MKETLIVNMLGTFSLSLGENQINCDINRSKRVWLLLAYLLYNRHRIVPQNELIDLLWNSSERESTNAAGALKTTMHRVRNTLDLLCPDFGHSMIVNSKGGYGWNPEITVELDVERLEELSHPSDNESLEAKAERLLEAANLYNGEFLDKLSSDTWTLPISVYFNNLYKEILEQLLSLLDESGRHADAVAISRKALKIDPYEEAVYQHLMRNLIALDEREAAAEAYEELNKLLFSDFGVVPSPESRALYREALRTVNRQYVPAGMIRDQLREIGPVYGALICDYDFFKMFYQAEARLIARNGDAIHIALFSLAAAPGKELSRKSLDYAMDNLKDHLHRGLRKGDIVSRCSPCQYVVMLSGANYENSCMVCQRLVRSFVRQYPHSSAQIEFTIQPLTPQDNRTAEEVI